VNDTFLSSRIITHTFESADQETRPASTPLGLFGKEYHDPNFNTVLETTAM
jgi:hypothetical protein